MATRSLFLAAAMAAIFGSAMGKNHDFGHARGDSPKIASLCDRSERLITLAYFIIGPASRAGAKAGSIRVHFRRIIENETRLN